MAATEVAVTHRATGTLLTGASVSKSPVVPPAARDGDYMVLICSIATATLQTLGLPAGWVQKVYVNVRSPSLVVLTKVCNGDAGNAQLLSWQASVGSNAVILAYSNVDTIDPDDTPGTTDNAASTTTNWPAATSSLGNKAIYAGSTVGITSSPGLPTGASSRVASTSGPALRVADIVSTAQAIAATTSTSTSSAAETALLPLRAAVGPSTRDSIAQALGAATTVTVTMPVFVPGDLQTVQIFVPNGATTISTPAGWTLEYTSTGQSTTAYVFSRVTDASSTDEVFNLSTNAQKSYVTTTWVGALGVESVSATFTASGTSNVAPAVTEQSYGCALCYTGYIKQVSGTVTWVGLTATGAGVSSATGGSISQAYEVNAEPQTRPALTSTATTGVQVGVTMVLRAGRAPQIREVAARDGASSNSTSSPTLPNTQDGDTIVAIAWSANSGSNITPPTPANGEGWTLIDSATTTNSMWIYKKTSRPGDDGGTWSFSGGIALHYIVYVVLVGQVDVVAVVKSAVATTATPEEPTTLTVDGDDSLILSLLALTSWSGVTAAAPAGSTLVQDGALPSATPHGISLATRKGAANNTATAVTSTALWTVSASSTSTRTAAVVARRSKSRPPAVTRQAIVRAARF